MSFKKDYINYALSSVLNTEPFSGREYFYLRKILERIITNDDVAKTIFIVGKTEGLEQLFKYLIYISDKIDKSQVSIFNFKGNTDYDITNLRKICDRIAKTSKAPVTAEIVHVPVEQSGAVVHDEELVEMDSPEKTVSEEKETPSPDTMIHVEAHEEAPGEMTEEKPEENELEIPEHEQVEEDSSLTLIENKEQGSEEKDVFELSEISESIGIIEDIPENAAEEITDNITSENVPEDLLLSLSYEDLKEGTSLDDILLEKDEREISNEPAAAEQDKSAVSQEGKETTPQVPVEISGTFSGDSEHGREEPAANDVYYKFENKFFEEVKILEKLFNSVDRDVKSGKEAKLSEGSLHRYTEIIGISSELANLTRQLSFDLMSDIFMTINIFFTKVINKPLLVTPLRIKLFISSLELANSLIKGKDFLNYDMVVKEIEKLKLEMEEQPSGKGVSMILPGKEEPVSHTEEPIVQDEPEIQQKAAQETEIREHEFVRTLTEKKQEKSRVDESLVFKLKYLVKQLETTYLSISQIQGEYRKFDALEKIDEMNATLKMIAKLSSSAKLFDALKLSEVSYIFLKYLRDYRMDLQDAEILQILKYIIFTFKMLLTKGKPEDFNVLVQYLNDPVKIFTNA